MRQAIVLAAILAYVWTHRVEYTINATGAHCYAVDVGETQYAACKERL